MGNKNFNSVEEQNITLDDWVKIHYTEEEMQSVFLNLDVALKYIHNHGYCIEVFHPSQIEVLNNDDNYIQFKRLVELPDDSTLASKMIKEDVFNSSLIQIGLYSKSLKYLTPDFLKENFDSFSQFLPNGDVAYYRGVVQRGASVYLCDYALDKRKRDLMDLEKQLGDSSGNSEQIFDGKEIENNKINDLIYRQINNVRDRAFINILFIPIMILLVILIYEIAIFFPFSLG